MQVNAKTGKPSPLGDPPALPGGSKSLTNPAVGLCAPDCPGHLHCGAGFVVLTLIGCDQAPLRGQQPESLRLCRRIIT